MQSIRDVPNPIVSSRYMRAVASSPLSTSRQPSHAQIPPSKKFHSRAKSTFAKLRSLYIKHEPQQETAPGSAEQYPKSYLEVQAEHQNPTTNSSSKSSPPSHRPEKSSHPHIRKTIPKEPDRPIVRRLIDIVKATESSHSKTHRTGSSSMKLEKPGVADQEEGGEPPTYQKNKARYLQHNPKEPQRCDQKKQQREGGKLSKHEDIPQQYPEARRQKRKSWRQQRKSQREELQRHLEERKHGEEKRQSQVIIRRVFAAPLSGSNTEAGRISFTLQDLTESVRVSGKVIARLTEQLRLIMGLKKPSSGWRQRTRKQGRTLNKPRNIVRTVRSQTKNANQGKPQGAIKVRRYNSERGARIVKYRSTGLRVRRSSVEEKRKSLEEEVEGWLGSGV